MHLEIIVGVGSFFGFTMLRASPQPFSSIFNSTLLNWYSPILTVTHMGNEAVWGSALDYAILTYMYQPNLYCTDYHGSWLHINIPIWTKTAAVRHLMGWAVAK